MLKKIKKVLLPHWTDLWSEIICFDEKTKVLHLGCGNSKIQNTVSVDINSKANPDIVWDLNNVPWPIEDNKFDRTIALNVIEHLNDTLKLLKEIYRVSKNNAIINILVPHFSSGAAFVDPTHKSYFSYRTFDYFIKGKDLENEYGFYDEMRFELKKYYIQISPFWRFVPFVLFFVRKFPKLWEDYLCYIIRGEGIFFQLEVKKNNL